MQNIEQFVRERQEIKPLQTCESYFLTFPQKICGVSVIRFALQKTVQVDTRFYQDTDNVLLTVYQWQPCGSKLAVIVMFTRWRHCA